MHDDHSNVNRGLKRDLTIPQLKIAPMQTKIIFRVSRAPDANGAAVP